MTNRILSIIPARGGSKGLPRKNIVDLVGKPLIAWTIEASLNSKYITKTVVSSDDIEILDISIKYGAGVVRRPSELANDIATSESVVKHSIDYLESIGKFLI
jgi:CMP-N-acetylneuraminic acid synthetase